MWWKVIFFCVTGSSKCDLTLQIFVVPLRSSTEAENDRARIPSLTEDLCGGSPWLSSWNRLPARHLASP